MAANIGEFRKKVETRILDEAPRLTRAEIAGHIDQAILSALVEYQTARPRERVTKVAGNGGFDYAIAGLTGWQDGFSVIRELAFPYATTDRQLTVLDEEAYAVVRLDTGLFLRFYEDTPTAAQFFLAKYTTPHTVDASASTVVAADDEALSDLAAAVAFEKLAAAYAQDTDASVLADAVDRKSKTDLYLRLAGAMRARYEQKLQIGKAQGPASRIVHVERRFGDQQRTELHFHGRR